MPQHHRVEPAQTLPPTNSNFQDFEPTIQDYEGTVAAASLSTSAPTTPTTTAAPRPLGPAMAISDLPLLDCKAFNATIHSGNTNMQEVVVLDKKTYFPSILMVQSAADLHSRHPDELRGKKAIFLHAQYLPQGRLPGGEEFFFVPRKSFSSLKSVNGEPNGRAFFPLNRANQVPSFAYYNEKKESLSGSERQEGSEPFSVIFIVLVVAIALMAAAAVVNRKDS